MEHLRRTLIYEIGSLAFITCSISLVRTELGKRLSLTFFFFFLHIVKHFFEEKNSSMSHNHRRLL